MQRDWYNIELKQKLRILKNSLGNPGVDEELVKKSIEAIEDITEKEPHIKLTSTADILFYEYQYLKKHQVLWDFCTEFSNCEINETYSLPYPEIDLKDQDILDLTHDFFKNATNKHVYDLFCKLYRQKKNLHFLTRENDIGFYAESTFIPYDKSFYVQMCRKNEFSDIPTMVHEFGHGIQLLTNYSKHLFNRLESFIEIISTFFELICGYYYTKDPLLAKKAIVSNYDTWDITCESALNIIQEIQLFKSIGLNSYDNKIETRRKIDEFVSSSNEEELQELLGGFPSNDCIYVIAFLIATSLFMIYLKDPEHSFYLLDKIMHIDLTLDSERYLEELLNLGILPGENLRDYDQHIKRELTRL